MIIYAVNPELKSDTSQILERPASDYPEVSDEVFVPFTEHTTFEEIEDRLYGMLYTDVHLANDETGVAYHSGKLAEIVEMIKNTGHPALFTTLTRQYGLREAVLNILKEQMVDQKVNV